MNDDRLWNPADLAQFLGVPVSTVYRWNQHATGPRPIRVGRHVRYTPESVVAWLEANSDPQ